MLSLVFSSAIQAGIDSGLYRLAMDATGRLLPYAIDNAGKIVGMGRLVDQFGFLASPIIAPAQMASSIIMDGAQMVQTHQGFQKTYRMLDSLQASIGILQSTTALIGLGTVTGVVLSAVNLHQTLKLREDIKQLRLEVKDGFIDLKKAIKDQGSEILQRIDELADDIEFRHHRTILAQAYGQFLQTLVHFKDSLKLTDTNLRNSNISNAQQMLYQSLAAYNNPLLLKDTSLPGQLRLKECAWMIEQTITYTFQEQGAYEVVSDRISKLQYQIRQATTDLITQCQSEDELAFLFPEIVRLNNHDLATLDMWQGCVNWMRSLSPVEQQNLFNINVTEIDEPQEVKQADILAQPSEQLLYEELKSKSHFESLKDQLKFMNQPDLRQQHEIYITQQGLNSNYKALVPSNWQEVPDFTVANLYWYFKAGQNQLS